MHYILFGGDSALYIVSWLVGTPRCALCLGWRGLRAVHCVLSGEGGGDLELCIAASVKET